jgi:hypothetical protein
MDETADLLRELIAEVQEMKTEIMNLTSPEPYAAGYNLKDLIDAISGPLGNNLGDVVDAIRDLDLQS